MFLQERWREDLKMGCFMKANKVSRYNIKMLWGNIRIPFILIIVVLYVVESLSAVSTFSQSVHINVTPFAFVFLINNYRIQFVIAACAVILCFEKSLGMTE